MFRRAITALVVAGFSLSLAAPPAVSAKKKTGNLRVVVTGTGSYQVIGKGIKRKSTKTKTFKLPVGKYRIKAKGATIKPRKVTVKKNKTRKATVTFTTAPTPTPTPKPTPTPTPNPTPPRFTPGAVQRVSESASDLLGANTPMGHAWSPDGNRIAFYALSANLAPGDTIFDSDVFVKDLDTGALQLISTNESGVDIANASYDENEIPSWSPDGEKVAFIAESPGMVAGATGEEHIYMKNLTTGAIRPISVSSAGTYGETGSSTPVWSPDGTRIAFMSASGNLVANDTGEDDMFVKTVATGEMQRVSISEAGTSLGSRSDPEWTPDSRRLLFRTYTQLVQKTLATGAVRVLAGSEATQYPFALSPDGKKIAFSSGNSSLVPDDTNGAYDIFIKTISNGAIQRVSTTSSGGQTNGTTLQPAWSPDGTKIAFRSWATNLVPGDTNGREDIFVKNLSTGTVTRVSTTSTGGQGAGASQDPKWSPDGSRVSFRSFSNLTGEGVSIRQQIYVKVLP